MPDYREAFVGIDVAKIKNAIAVAESGRNGEVRYWGEDLTNHKLHIAEPGTQGLRETIEQIMAATGGVKDAVDVMLHVDRIVGNPAQKRTTRAG